MRQALREALDECLARLEAGAGIDDCLRGREAVAAELRPLLEAAQALRGGRDSMPDYRTEALQAGRARMRAARSAQAERGGIASWTWLIGRPAAIVAVAAVVAVLAALGFTTDLFRFGADTTSASVEGVVSRVDPDAIVLMTDDGQVIVRIGGKTVVLDADGNVISGGDIVPGSMAKVEAHKDDGTFAAERIEVGDDDDGAHGAEVEFTGVVTLVDGSVVEVQASFGVAAVRVDSQTEVKGTLQPGVTVEVDATLQADGSYLAREIEVKGGGGDGGHGAGDDDRRDGGSSGSGSGTSDDDDSGSGMSGSGSSGSGSGEHRETPEDHDATSSDSGPGGEDHKDDEEKPEGHD